MFGRFFDSFNTRFATRGSRSAVNGHARMHSCSDCACAENMNSLLNLGTVIAVSIFAALRLIVIRLVSLISLIGLIIVRIIIGAPSQRPRLAAAY